ncbi:MAG: DegT/DnrJ/EryC1/StrS family aminotransferase [Clostridiales bacterium]|nr:DegT/DnrJ/EryC1/StrS family aminotransferase [Clostridiales bacterium]
MEFRDLKTQYRQNQKAIDRAIAQVMESTHFISGSQVEELEEKLAEYVGVKYCITCGNGTDALLLALMAWDIGAGDLVFVPDFTFFSSAEVIVAVGATPVFVDVDYDTFNMDVDSLKQAIDSVEEQDRHRMKAVVAVDLFGQPARLDAIRKVASDYGMLLLEDGAQGFGGELNGRKACSFGDISTTSFFPAKPLGCYGDGGAVFTDHEEWANVIRSLRVHGKGADKYDNVRIGMNSRLDTLQAAVLIEKLRIFKEYEMEQCDKAAALYTDRLEKVVHTPRVLPEMRSSWAQYTVKFDDGELRDRAIAALKKQGIPTAVYYARPMHLQKAFAGIPSSAEKLKVSTMLCDVVLSLPMHPYLEEETIARICDAMIEVAS